MRGLGKKKWYLLSGSEGWVSGSEAARNQPAVTDAGRLFEAYERHCINPGANSLSPPLPKWPRITAGVRAELRTPGARGVVARLVGMKGGVVSGVFNLESSGVEAPDWRPRHDKQYHEA